MAAEDAVTIDDNYEHDDPNLEYILENVLCEELNNKDNNDSDACKLRELYNSVLSNACKCETLCDDWSLCKHGGNYVLNKYVEPPELVLAKTRRNEIFYECIAECSCSSRPEDCHNRRVQFGPRKNLKIIKSEIYQSKGLATTADIPTGAFICEYVGELLTPTEAKRRTEENERTGKMNYILCLNEIPVGCSNKKENCIKTIIDPSRKGNIGRYINHSCEPNCEIYSVRVNCPVPKICIFSKNFIEAGKELSFHYGGEQIDAGIPIQPNGRVPCLCNSENCEKFLPNDVF